MSNQMPFKERMKRVTIGFTGITVMLASLAIVTVTPFLMGTASAATGSSTDISIGGIEYYSNGSARNANSTPADEYYGMATCVAKMDTMPLTDGNIKEYLGTSSVPSGTTSKAFIGDYDQFKTTDAMLSNYNKFLTANKGKNVAVVTFRQAAAQSSNATAGADCGGEGWNAGKFVLLPVQNFTSDADTNPDNPRTWIGIHHTYVGFSAETSYSYLRFTAAGSANGGTDTVGRLESFKTIQTNNGRDLQRGTTNNFVVEGRAKPSGSVVSGNTKTARFISASTIETTITVNGKDYKETYVDPSWDNIRNYFLTKSELEARNQISYDAQNVGPKANPSANGAPANSTPFIHLEGPPINLSYVSGKTTPDFQNGINALGGSARLYDYDVTGAPIGTPNPNNNAISLGESLDGRLNRTDSRIWFYYHGGNNAVVSVFTQGDGNEQPYAGEYAEVGNGNTDFVKSDGICSNRGVLKFSKASASTNVTGTWTLKSPQCAVGNGYGDVSVVVLKDETLYNQIAEQIAADEAELSEDADAGKVTCDASISSPLTWIMCPIASAATAGVDLLDSVINSILNINGDRYFGDNTTGNKLYQVWSNLRTVAMGIIVLTGLAIIIAQASGWEAISALTLRKAAPPFAFTLVLLAAWWPIGRAIIQLGDVATFGIRHLIYAPFGDVAVFKLDGASGTGGTSAALALLGSAYLLSLGIFATATFAVTAFVGALVGVAILSVRVAFVIAFQVLSEIFIPFKAIPNMVGVWKFFWGGFTKAVAAGALIAGVVAIARVVAGIIYTTSQAATGPVKYAFLLMAIGIYYGIWFFMMEILSFLGGTFATLAGRVNDRSRGIFDRMKNTRQKAPGDRFKRFKHGELWNDGLIVNSRKGGPGGSASRFAGRMGERLNLGLKNNYGFGDKGMAAQFYHDEGLVDDHLRQNNALRSLTLNDDESTAVLGLSGGTEKGARAAIKDINEGRIRAEMAKGKTRAEAERDANQIQGAEEQQIISRIAPMMNNRLSVMAAQRAMMQNKARAIGAGDFESIENGVNRFAEGNSYYASSLKSSLAYFGRAGASRMDLGAEPSAIKDSRGNLKGVALDLKNSGASTEQAAAMARMLDGDQRGDIGSLLRGHTSTVQQAANTVSYLLDPKNAVSDEVRKKAAMLGYEMTMGNNPQVNSANRDIVNKLNSQLGVDVGGRTKQTISDQYALRVTTNKDAWNGQELQNQSRAYSSDVPMDQRLPPGSPGGP